MKAAIIIALAVMTIYGQKFYPYLSYDREKAGAGIFFDLASPKAMMGFGLAYDFKDEIRTETMSIYGYGLNKPVTVRTKEADFEITFAYKINRAFIMAGIDLMMVKSWVDSRDTDWKNDGVYPELRIGSGYITEEGYVFGASIYKDFLRGYLGYAF